MSKEVHDFLEELLKHLHEVDFVRAEDVPNIALYMDQVTSFMDDQLASSRRHNDDKILTKTMINNYTKNDLLPPPDRKKYSKEHVLTLLFIYYFKNVMSISDIQSLLTPLTDKYFGNTEGFNIESIYKEIFDLAYEESKKSVKDLGKKFVRAQDTFLDYPEEDQKFLHDFSFICMMAYDVYLKKMLIENMIDHMIEENDD